MPVALIRATARRRLAAAAVVAVTAGLLVTVAEPASAAPQPSVPATTAYRVAEPSSPYDDVHTSQTVATATGDLASAGWYSGTVTFGGQSAPGPSGGFVTDRSADGSAVRWTQFFRAADPSGTGGNATAITATPGGPVVLGNYYEPMSLGGEVVQPPSGGGSGLYVAGLRQADGEEQWARPLTTGPGWLSVYSSMTSQGGVVYVAGSFGGDVDFGAGPVSSSPGSTGAYLVALDAGTGQLLRQVVFTSTDQVLATRVAVAPDGTVVVGGGYVGELDLDGVASGPSASTGATFVAAFTPAGAVRWVRGYPQSEWEGENTVSGLVATDDRVFLTGRSDLELAVPGGGLAALDAATGDVMWEADHPFVSTNDAQNPLALLPDGLLVATVPYSYDLYLGLDSLSGVDGADAALLGYRADDGQRELLGNLASQGNDVVSSLTTDGSDLVVSGRFGAVLADGSSVPSAGVARLTTPALDSLPTLTVPDRGTVGDVVRLSMTPGSEAGLFDANATSCQDLTGSGSDRDILLAHTNRCTYLFRRPLVAGWQATTLARDVAIDPATATGSWADPAPITYGERLTWQLQAAFTGAHGESIWGPITYDPTFNTLLDAGTHTLHARLVSDDYLPAEATSTLVVRPATPTVSFSAPQTYGQTLPQVAFTGIDGAPVPGTVTQDPPAGTVLSAGWHDVTATLTSASGNYTDLTVVKHVNVAQADPRVDWTVPASVVYGHALGDAELSATVLGVDGRPLPASLYYYPGSGSVLGAGSWQIALTARTTDPNYTGYIRVYRGLTVTRAETSLTTGFDPLGAKLTAVLRDTSNGVVLAGRTVEFATGSQQCEAVTDSAGRATCPLYAVDLLAALNAGFDVSYGGDANYQASTAHGRVV